MLCRAELELSLETEGEQNNSTPFVCLSVCLSELRLSLIHKAAVPLEASIQRISSQFQLCYPATGMNQVYFSVCVCRLYTLVYVYTTHISYGLLIRL